MAASAALGGLGYPMLYIVSFMLASTTVLVILRAVHASRRGRRLRWDFIWIALAWITAMIAGGLLFVSIIHGLGNRQANLAFKDLIVAIEYSLLAVYFGSVSICLSKFSVVALLLEVESGTGQRKKRMALLLVSAVFGLTTTLQVIFSIVQCRPYRKSYISTVPGTCNLKQAAYDLSYAHAGVGAATDLLLAIWPVSIVGKLQMSRKLKIGFCLLMAIGALPGIAACYRLYQLRRVYNDDDYTYEAGKFLMWAAVETTALILLGSIPPLRLFFVQFGKRLMSAATGRTTLLNTTGAGQTRETQVTGGDGSRHVQSAMYSGNGGAGGGKRGLKVSQYDDLDADEVPLSEERGVRATTEVTVKSEQV